MFPNPGAAGPHKNCLWDQESSHTEEPLFILGVSSLFSWNDVLLKKQSLGKSVHNCLPVPPSWVLFIEHQKELCQRKWSATAAGGLSDYGCSVLQLRKSLAVNPGFRKEDHSRPPELRRRGGRSAFFSSRSGQRSQVVSRKDTGPEHCCASASWMCRRRGEKRGTAALLTREGSSGQLTRNLPGAREHGLCWRHEGRGCICRCWIPCRAQHSLHEAGL
ncbi:uncharacterized protein LOC109461104 isoform X1 [Rhinolophus sinicus]|uniref:uncharacterized protein LOC109461104 isoform X1 n=2 Tax=Rhinolophus sinicus TaxID=89399 RepID=UPI003D7B5E1A